MFSIAVPVTPPPVMFLVLLCDELWFTKWPWPPSLWRVLPRQKQSSSLEMQPLENLALFLSHDCIGQFPSLKSEALWCSLVNPWSKLTCSRLFPSLPPILHMPPDFCTSLCPQTLTRPLLSVHTDSSLWVSLLEAKELACYHVIGDAPLKSEVSSLSQHSNSRRHAVKLSSWVIKQNSQ